MNDLFTFIVPVLNGEATLEKCLDSLQLQTYKNIEIIVVDNGSVDNTRKIVESRLGLRYLYVEKRSRSLARNTGALHAKGEYLCFVDCDVVLASDWLEKCIEYLKKIPCDCLATQIVPEGNELSLVDSYRHFFADWKSHSTFLSIQKRTTPYPVINTAACVIKKDSFELIGGFNEALLRNEDLELSLRFFLEGYLLGGTLEARGRVGFNETSGAFFRSVGYLKRSFDVHYSNLFRANKVYTFNKDLIKALWKHPTKKYSLSLFAMAVEFFSFVGGVSSLVFRPKVTELSSYKLKRGKSAMLGSYFQEGGLNVPKSGVSFLFLGNKVYCSQNFNLDNFTQLQESDSLCIQKLFRQEGLALAEIESLGRLGLFERYSC